MKFQKKIKKFDFNGMMKRGHNYFFSVETSWNILSGGESFQLLIKISRILKVLAPEISHEIPKNNKFSILMV